MLNIYVTSGHIVPTRYSSFANRKWRVISNRRVCNLTRVSRTRAKSRRHRGDNKRRNVLITYAWESKNIFHSSHRLPCQSLCLLAAQTRWQTRCKRYYVGEKKYFTWDRDRCYAFHSIVTLLVRTRAPGWCQFWQPLPSMTFPITFSHRAE